MKTIAYSIYKLTNSSNDIVYRLTIHDDQNINPDFYFTDKRDIANLVLDGSEFDSSDAGAMDYIDNEEDYTEEDIAYHQSFTSETE